MEGHFGGQEQHLVGSRREVQRNVVDERPAGLCKIVISIEYFEFGVL